MNKLNIELTNCFGIDSLNHEFDFGKGNTFSIYARNGLMKTSFAKTFQLIQQGKKENISDAIFGEPGSAIVQIDGQDIEKKQVFVVKSYESSYESDISSLLIKGDIQTQLKDVFKVRTKLLKALEKDSGLKIKRTSLGKTVYELEPTIVKDFDFNEKDILSNLINYGYIEGVMAPDGEEQDAYILGVNEPVKKFTGKIIAIVRRKDDIEEKWVVVPDGVTFSKEEIRRQIHFQEQYFDSEIVM